MKNFYLLSLLVFGMMCVPVSSFAQSEGYFRHWDVALTGGTTGVGIEVATQVGSVVRLRTGFDIIPRFEKDIRFEVASFDNNGKIKAISKFPEYSTRLKQLGFDVKDYIDMTCKPTFSNFKFLVDVFPFKNHKTLKHFYVTAGFYWGPSKIGEAVNSVEGAQTLVGMQAYNWIYDNHSEDYEKLYPFIKGNEPMTITAYDIDGEPYTLDVYLDPRIVQALNDKVDLPNPKTLPSHVFVNMGTFTHDIVDDEGNVIHKAGSHYLMEPLGDATVRAKACTNSFKPYLGLGYKGRLIKNNDRFHVGVDCGVLFWGGKPAVYSHDGINLTRDVDCSAGKVRKYVNLIGDLVVYPVLNVRFSCNIF